jgi:uncharacterized membrane protein
MALMAIDHASFFIARVHPFESWAFGPPYYASTTAFITRWVTHLCAPGFFLLMGAGMAMFAASRRQAGWSRKRVSRLLITRGLVLIVIQQLIENPAWLLGILSANPDLLPLAPTPGEQGDELAMPILVLTALGVSMIVWGLLIEVPNAVVLALSVGALGASMLITPGPQHANDAYPILMRVLFIPGQTTPVSVAYAVIPWLTPAGLGILLGRMVMAGPSFLEKRVALIGAFLIATFIVLRAANLGDYHAAEPGLIGFLTVTKYPPSLDFFALMLGIDMVLLALFTRSMPGWVAGPLQLFGQVPLFFYLLHLYVFGALSWFFRDGTSFGVMYLVWLAALAVMYPACRWYARFKSSRPIASVWRLL